MGSERQNGCSGEAQSYAGGIVFFNPTSCRATLDSSSLQPAQSKSDRSASLTKPPTPPTPNPETKSRPGVSLARITDFRREKRPII